MSEVQFLTVAFKLHKPSGRRRAIMDQAFEAHNQTLTAVLDDAKARLDEIRSAACYARTVRVKRDGVMVEEERRQWNARNIQPHLARPSALGFSLSGAVSDGLMSHAAAALASYFMLEDAEDQNPSLPETRELKAADAVWREALEGLTAVLDDLDEYNEARDELTRAKRGVAPEPIHFVRARDCRILYDTERDRFFAYLPLVAIGDPLAQVAELTGNLADIGSGELLVTKSKGNVLMPLELGRRNEDWHWQYYRFLKPVMDGEAAVKAAKLVCVGEPGPGREYYLHVSVAFPCPEPYEPQAYMGIDVGVFFQMAYGLVDLDGRIVRSGKDDGSYYHVMKESGHKRKVDQQQGRRPTLKDFRRKGLEGMLHSFANELLDIAERHQAQIMIEDLKIRVKGSFYTSCWRKVYGILAYKAKMRGVPIRNTFAANSSMICIYCGELCKRNDRELACKNPGCGRKSHSDEAAGINLARRAMYKKAEWEKRGGYFGFHRQFAEFYPQLTAKDRMYPVRPDTRPAARYTAVPLFAGFGD